jgi:hypothetical protein
VTTPAAVPPPETTSRAGLCEVKLDGEDLAVVLRAASGSYPVPGWAPPGTYTITAEFPAVGRRDSGTVTLIEGAGVTIQCDSKFGKCQQR